MGEGRSGSVLVDEGAIWRYFRGTSEPSEGIEWTVPDFDDGSWETGASGFGYGDEDDNTLLDDMLGAYTTVYVRHVFEVPPMEGLRKLVLTVRSDDGFVAYLNGEGIAWERDRFFTGGQCSNAQPTGWITSTLEDSEDGPVFAEGRYFRWDDVAPAGYRVPLPPGRYRVGLHFSEILYTARPGGRVFDVVIEGRRVLEKYDVFARVGFARLEVHRLDVHVTDGILDIVFERRVENPRIAALEIEVLE